MKKMIYIIIGVVVVIIVLFGIFKWWGNYNNKHVYLKHINGEDSKLFIDCKDDSECEFASIKRGYSDFDCININNNEINIDEFNDKEKKLIQKVNSYRLPEKQNINEYQPKCINNVCTVVKKDEINEVNIINQNNEAMQGKIAAPKEIKISWGEVKFIAPNSFDQPSLVTAKKGGKTIWQTGYNVPKIDSDLEKDVQLLDYFVTEMRIDNFELKDALYVTIGDGIKARTSIYNPENGELLNLIIISPPPAE